MFDRIMFIIVLALFALIPASLVYAVENSEYFNLGEYTPYDNNQGFQYTINPALSPSWFSSPSSACSAYLSILLPTKPTNMNYTGTYITSPGTDNICYIKRTWHTPDLPNKHNTEMDPIYSFIAKRAIPACTISPDTTEIQWAVEGNISTPYQSACSNSCEYNHVSSGGFNTLPSAIYDSTNKLTVFTIFQAKRSGKSCSLDQNDPPTCTDAEKAANGGKCLTPDSDGNKCSDAEKLANGGKCNVPDDDGNSCPAAEKLANGGKCQVADPNGNKCTDAEKAANGGTCQTADGDGNKCTDALKAASGGKCPTQGSGECTPEQKAANGGTCPVGSGGTCTANPINKKFCDLADWLTGGDDFELPDQETEIPKREISRDELPQAQQINFPASCPAGETFSAFGQTVTLSYDVACDLMRMIRPFVILAGNLLALFIFINSIRN